MALLVEGPPTPPQRRVGSQNWREGSEQGTGVYGLPLSPMLTSVFTPERLTVLALRHGFHIRHQVDRPEARNPYHPDRGRPRGRSPAARPGPRRVGGPLTTRTGSGCTQPAPHCYVKVTKNSDGSLTKAPKIGLAGPFDNVWAKVWGIDLYYESGKDTNLRDAAVLGDPEVGPGPAVTTQG